MAGNLLFLFYTGCAMSGLFDDLSHDEAQMVAAMQAMSGQQGPAGMAVLRNFLVRQGLRAITQAHKGFQQPTYHPKSLCYLVDGPPDAFLEAIRLAQQKPQALLPAPPERPRVELRVVDGGRK